MLAVQKQPKYLSKVITMSNGTDALVIFELIERNGHIIARAVYAETIKASSIPEQEVFMLPGDLSSATVIPTKSYFSTYVSPFFKDFTFLTSQLTRAPSTI